eukprot:Rhum_TRINITY_DN16460_c0_g1::Rhum_TRINITY_DN16460_c0_g1_i1::g.163121::m.163121/K13510/LPCAT1_2; lysophosphatidylcholine acyltransferase / lyso-PAF acetyltransferase
MEVLGSTPFKIALMAILLYLFSSGLVGGGRAVFGEAEQENYEMLLKSVLGDADGAVPRVSDLTEGVNQRVAQAMRELFDELDENHDGCVEYKEFVGMTLSTWATFRSLDAALKSRLQMPSFEGLRSAIRKAVKDTFPNVVIPEEFSLFPADATWWETVWYAASRYVVFLIWVQCMLCACENITALFGLRAFYFTKKTAEDVAAVPHVQKEKALEYDTPVTPYETAKIVLMTCSGLALLRLVQMVFFLMVGFMCVNASAIVPSRIWRFFWLRLMATLCIQGLMFSLGYYRVGVEGKVCKLSDAKILVGNHMAVVELLIMFQLSFPSFISAVENEAVPLFSGVVKACNAILVDRLDKHSKRNTMKEIKRRCEDPLAPQLMIFPEGTLNNQQALFKFKPGAFEPGKPVQPFCFKYPFKYFNPCWTGEAMNGHDSGECVWRCVCQFVNRLEVKILPVYVPSEEEKADKFLYSENVRRVIAANLEIGLSDCMYEDYVQCGRRYAQLKRAALRAQNRLGPVERWALPFQRTFRVGIEELMAPHPSDHSASEEGAH